MYQIVSWLVSWLINTGSNQGFKHLKEGHFWHAGEQGAHSKVGQPGTIQWFFQQYGSCKNVLYEKQKN